MREGNLGQARKVRRTVRRICERRGVWYTAYVGRTGTVRPLSAHLLDSSGVARLRAGRANDRDHAKSST